VQRNREGLTAPRWSTIDQKEFRNNYGVPSFPAARSNAKPRRARSDPQRHPPAIAIFGGELIVVLARSWRPVE
jgi:hypothetical protein